MQNKNFVDFNKSEDKFSDLKNYFSYLAVDSFLKGF